MRCWGISAFQVILKTRDGAGPSPGTKTKSPSGNMVLFRTYRERKWDIVFWNSPAKNQKAENKHREKSAEGKAFVRDGFQSGFAAQADTGGFQRKKEKSADLLLRRRR